ncbi:hypothetical protein [Escherichia coli]|nr:hypothetical protein [Escherichia coli]QXA64764.1 hypothetical protein I6L18_17775 [Escherichia coli]QXB52889.1 hypothetical protein I6L19_19015 [Escherichia coli]
MPPATERWHFFVLFVSYFAITMMNIAICETIITVVLYSSKGGVMAISVKPVLISEKQMEAIKKIQEEQRKKSGIGVAPTLHEIARGLIDKALAGCM